MQITDQQVAQFTAAVTRWEDARLQANRLSESLLVLRMNEPDMLRAAQLSQELGAVQRNEARLLEEATKCLDQI